MSCKKCEDIHTAQLAGHTGKSCECFCHNGFSYTPNVTCTSTTGIDGNTWTTGMTTCTTDGCTTLNFNND